MILTKTGITNVPGSDITGNLGTSPIDSTAITGFSLIADAIFNDDWLTTELAHIGSTSHRLVV